MPTRRAGGVDLQKAFAFLALVGSLGAIGVVGYLIVSGVYDELPAKPTIQFASGDIVFRRAPAGVRDLYLRIGAGTRTSDLKVECLVKPDPETEEWPCRRVVNLRIGVDYWVDMRGSLLTGGRNEGLAGGDIFIRDQRVSRKIQISDAPPWQLYDSVAFTYPTWTAGRFKIVDENGAIQ